MSVLDFEAQWCRDQLEQMKRDGSSQFEDWFGSPTSTTKTVDENMDHAKLKADAQKLLDQAIEKEREAQQLRVQAAAKIDAYEKFIALIDENQT